MPDLPHLLAFATLALGMVLMPGPNMVYLISRSLSQGRIAGLISLMGVGAAFLFYMTCAAFGITGLVMAVPYAYEALRLAGALYLLYLAWQAVRPGARSPLSARALPKDAPRKLFAMGFLTNLLNPKAAVLYLSLLPQFITPEAGSVLMQSLMLGGLQIAISLSVNAMIVLAAGTIGGVISAKPVWITLQRWLMGGVLDALALRMLAEGRR